MRFKLILLFLALSLVLPASVLAQDGELPGGLLGRILGWVLGAGGITLIGQLLKGLNLILPPWMKVVLPPALGAFAGWLSSRYGIIVDFGPILGILLGTTSTWLFNLGKKTKVLKA